MFRFFNKKKEIPTVKFDHCDHEDCIKFFSHKIPYYDDKVTGKRFYYFMDQIEIGVLLSCIQCIHFKKWDMYIENKVGG